MTNETTSKYAGHTPGPLVVREANFAGAIFQRRRWSIAHEETRLTVAENLLEADALLMKDAPLLLEQRNDLLAALQGLLREMTTENIEAIGMEMGWSNAGAVRERINTAEAAIARAEGERAS